LGRSFQPSPCPVRVDDSRAYRKDLFLVFCSSASRASVTSTGLCRCTCRVPCQLLASISNSPTTGALPALPPPPAQAVLDGLPGGPQPCGDQPVAQPLALELQDLRE